jgi:hypothetical protein
LSESLVATWKSDRTKQRRLDMNGLWLWERKTGGYTMDKNEKAL